MIKGPTQRRRDRAKLPLHGAFAYAFALLFLSCTSNPSPRDIERITPSATILFETGFTIRSAMSRVWDGENGDSERIYLSDPTTKKVCCAYDLQGKLMNTISLESAIGTIGPIKSISILGQDSVLVISEEGDQAAIVTGNSPSPYVFSLKPYTILPNGDRVRFHGSIISSFTQNNCILLQCSYVENVLDSSYIWWGNKRLYTLKKQGAGALRSPLLSRICLVDSSVSSSTYGLYGFLGRFEKEPYQYVQSPIYSVVGDSIFFASGFSDSIYVVDSRSLREIGSFKIHSNLSPARTIPVPFTQQEADSLGVYLNRRLQTQASIQGLVRDKLTGHFIIALYHEVPWNSDKNHRNVNRSFSLLEYDEHLNHRIHEYLFDDLKYNGYSLLATDLGVLMQEHEDRSVASGSVHRYGLFRFNIK